MPGLALAVALACLPGPASAAAAGETVRLSNERTKTVFAYVDRATWARSKPDADAARLARVGAVTYSGHPEVVLALARRSVGGRSWTRVRYPGIGRRVGWVPTAALEPGATVTTLLVVERARLRVRLLRDGRELLRARAGVGAPGSPTPAGRFYVRERIRPASPRGMYGPIAFGLSAFSRYRTDWPGGGQVGVHGTNRPGLLPGRVSNGCVRLRNRDIRRLARRMPVGTPVLVK